MPSPSLRTSLLALVGSRLVINTAQRFVYPFLPAIARGLGISLEQAGLLVSVRWMAGLLTPAAVAVAGEGERRKLAISGLVMFAVGAAATALTNVYVGALLGFALMGIGKPVHDVAAQSYVADRTPYASRARYLSVLEWTWSVGLLLGAPAAGWAIDHLGWEAPFLILAGLALAMVPVLQRSLDDKPLHRPGVEARIRIDRTALGVLVAAALFSAAAEAMFVVFGAWLEGAYGLSLIALGGAGFVVGFAELGGEGATTVFTDRMGKERSVALGLVISIVGFGLLGFDPSQVWVGMLLVAVGFFGFEFTIVSAIPLASEVAPSSRARYLALFIVAMSLGRAAGAATGPLLFDAFGLIGNSLAAAGVDLIALVIILRMHRAR